MEQMDFRSFYLKEFELFDGEYFVKFNIVDIDTDKMTIKLAITHTGKIIITEYDLKRDKNNNLYFEYGIDFNKIKVDDFEEIEN